jgi:4,5-DOPA dioxygenase extradiol
MAYLNALIFLSTSCLFVQGTYTLTHFSFNMFNMFILFMFIPLAYLFASSINQAAITQSIRKTASIMSASTSRNRPPVYFLGIGGPNFLGDTEHPAYSKLAAVGQEITTKVKPKAVIVFSAHWQAGPNKVQINAAEKTDLIYDFYGFPPHYYEYDYPNKGSPELAGRIVERLSGAGIEVEKVKRGLDHGVWAGFMVGERILSLIMTQILSTLPLTDPWAAFDPQKNPLNVPLVQVSLFGNENWDQHYRMGQALEGLRDEGVLIIGAGMAVHNLRDYRAIMATKKTMP